MKDSWILRAMASIVFAVLTGLLVVFIADHFTFESLPSFQKKIIFIVVVVILFPLALFLQPRKIENPEKGVDMTNEVLKDNNASNNQGTLAMDGSNVTNNHYNFGLIPAIITLALLFVGALLIYIFVIASHGQELVPSLPAPQNVEPETGCYFSENEIECSQMPDSISYHVVSTTTMIRACYLESRDLSLDPTLPYSVLLPNDQSPLEGNISVARKHYVRAAKLVTPYHQVYYHTLVGEIHAEGDQTELVIEAYQETIKIGYVPRSPRGELTTFSHYMGHTFKIAEFCDHEQSAEKYDKKLKLFKKWHDNIARQTGPPAGLISIRSHTPSENLRLILFQASI